MDVENKKRRYYIHVVSAHCVVLPIIEYWAKVMIGHVDRVALGFIIFTTKAL